MYLIAEVSPAPSSLDSAVRSRRIMF